jgi:hypothetical protein
LRLVDPDGEVRGLSRRIGMRSRPRAGQDGSGEDSSGQAPKG